MPEPLSAARVVPMERTALCDAVFNPLFIDRVRADDT